MTNRLPPEFRYSRTSVAKPALRSLGGVAAAQAPTEDRSVLEERILELESHVAALRNEVAALKDKLESLLG